MSFVIGGGSRCRFEVDIVSGLIVFGPHNSESKKNEHTCSEGKLCGEAGKITGLQSALNTRASSPMARMRTLCGTEMPASAAMCRILPRPLPGGLLLLSCL